MKIHDTEALLLDVFDLDDRDRLVTFLTREQGKKKGVAKGARTKHSRFAGQLQPLAKVRIHWAEKAGRELARINSVELVRPAHRLQEGLEGILLGAYLADHMVELVQEDEPGDLYFRLLDSTLEALLSGADPDLAARYFETWALRLAGIFPPPDDCPGCGGTLLEGAVLPTHGEALLCPQCGEGGAGKKIGPEVMRLLFAFGRMRLAALARQPADPRLLRQIEAINGQVRRAFLQKELRSYTVLRRTLAEVGGAEVGGSDGGE
jgi:DNA repair protein RecO (recombination protein O)